MSTFLLPDVNDDCPVHLPTDLTQDQLLSFPAFRVWSNTLKHSLSLQSRTEHPFHLSPYRLHSITVQCVDCFGTGAHKRLRFVKLRCEITNDDGAYLPGAVFMRGGAVGMLMILQPDDAAEGSDDDKYVLTTVQPRVAAGSLGFVEILPGMRDDSDSFSGTAAKEIEEETGLVVKVDELIDMTALALEDEQNTEILQKGIYSTPGGFDEFIPMFLYEKRLSRSELEHFQGRLTGLRDEGEKITVKVVRFERLWREAARDAKALAALALYQGLRKEGKI